MRVLFSPHVLVCVAGAALALFFCGPLPAADDFREQMKIDSVTMQALHPETEKLFIHGKFDEANQRLLAIFPKEKRTAAQALLLGNVLYGLDEKLSYALHKEAAEKAPAEPMALMEWAMEQHRAGEYAGALTAYEAYSKAHPTHAPVLGLSADCLIRLGRTKDAVKRWQDSEAAPVGKIETFEKLVCEIYKDSTFEQRRAAFRVKAEAGDVEAAVELIGLVASCEFDWWNRKPHRTYLQHDFALLEIFPPNPRIKAAKCVAECYLPEKPDEKEIRAILERHQLLLDPARTLPADPKFTALLFGIVHGLILSEKEIREQFGKTLLEDGLRLKNADLLNIVALVNVGQKGLVEIEQQAWEATGDVRFIGGYLAERLAEKSLKADDPLLVKALAQFPEDSRIQSFAIALARPPGEALLVQAIKAEYRRFSMSGIAGSGMNLRPRAQTLRSYFTKLAEIVK